MSIFNSGSYGRYSPCQRERPCCGLVSLVNVPVVTLSALYGIAMALPSRVNLVVRPCNCAGLTRLLQECTRFLPKFPQGDFLVSTL
ncbi:hypothetical protein PAPYR_13096 [Paratrimastix pyriformis]|uniref:Uncharacterized protein n=1 Tax=Paratrimastix pyriformis TaxID=342808 RepID=A0ABQ8U0W0_9EUKA|nr:hypothetical protein PAPYR_13096 [Paratrimastix pyriformis]